MYEVLLACLAVRHVWVWCPWRSEGVSDLLELELWLATSWCWQLSLGPLQEQQMVLTVEVSLRTHNIIFLEKIILRSRNKIIILVMRTVLKDYEEKFSAFYCDYLFIL